MSPITAQRRAPEGSRLTIVVLAAAWVLGFSSGFALVCGAEFFGCSLMTVMKPAQLCAGGTAVLVTAVITIVGGVLHACAQRCYRQQTTQGALLTAVTMLSVGVALTTADSIATAAGVMLGCAGAAVIFMALQTSLADSVHRWWGPHLRDTCVFWTGAAAVVGILAAMCSHMCQHTFPGAPVAHMRLASACCATPTLLFAVFSAMAPAFDPLSCGGSGSSQRLLPGMGAGAQAQLQDAHSTGAASRSLPAQRHGARPAPGDAVIDMQHLCAKLAATAAVAAWNLYVTNSQSTPVAQHTAVGNPASGAIGSDLQAEGPSAAAQSPR